MSRPARISEEFERELRALRASGMEWYDLWDRHGRTDFPTENALRLYLKRRGPAMAAAPIMGRQTTALQAVGIPASSWQISQVRQGLHRIRVPVSRREGWEFDSGLMADIHWDNPHCQRELLEYQMGWLRRRGAPVHIFGDLLCIMNTAGDRRASLGGIRPEHLGDNHVDLVIEDAIRYFSAWGDYGVISEGNHETAVRKWHNTDPTDRIVAGIRAQGFQAGRGMYTGWIVYEFYDPENPHWNQEFRVFYDHGSGGGGPVTQGVIGTNRRAVYIDRADLVVTGHIHYSWQVQIMKVDGSGEVMQTQAQDHVQCPTYKDEFSSGKGWAIETGKPPKPLGSWTLRHYWSPRARQVKATYFRTVE